MKEIRQYLEQFAVVSYRAVLPLIYIWFAWINWDTSPLQYNRLTFCNSLILLFGFDNCFILYRFVKNTTSYEYELSLLQALIYFINSLEGEEYTFQNMSVFEQTSYCLYFFVFFINMLTILIILTALTFFTCFIFAVGLSGDNNLNINRGLNQEEIDKLETITYEAFQKEKQNKSLVGGGHTRPPSKDKICVNKSNSSINKQKNNIQNQSLLNKSQHSIKSINVLLNSISVSLGDTDKCSICLVDYSLEDILIILPKCKHYFHQECIQLWFQSNSKCPFCRDNIILRLQS